MPLPLAVVLTLSEACAPGVAPMTLASITQVESRLNPIAIGVNGSPRVVVEASDAADAAVRAKALIAAGRSVDLGLAQINSGNLTWLGLSVEEAFDPCRNLGAAARVLQSGFAPETETAAEQQRALRVALSRYNTGHAQRGFDNGYVAKVVSAASGMAGSPIPASPTEPALQAAPAARWDVFAEAPASTSFLINVSTNNREGQP